MYLMLRNNTCHFRFVVPPHCRHTIGKREIRKSLKTGDKRKAQIQAIVLTGNLFAELEGIEPPTQVEFSLKEVSVEL